MIQTGKIPPRGFALVGMTALLVICKQYDKLKYEKLSGADFTRDRLKINRVFYAKTIVFYRRNVIE